GRPVSGAPNLYGAATADRQRAGGPLSARLLSRRGNGGAEAAELRTAGRGGLRKEGLSTAYDRAWHGQATGPAGGNHRRRDRARARWPRDELPQQLPFDRRTRRGAAALPDAPRGQGGESLRREGGSGACRGRLEARLHRNSPPAGPLTARRRGARTGRARSCAAGDNPADRQRRALARLYPGPYAG